MQNNINIFLKSKIKNERGIYLFKDDGTLNMLLLSNKAIMEAKIVINYGKSKEGFDLISEKILILRQEIFDSGFLYSKDNFRTEAFHECENGIEFTLSFSIITKKFIEYFVDFLPKENKLTGNNVKLANLLKISDDLFYDNENFIFYNSNNDIIFNVLNKRSGGQSNNKPDFYDVTIIVLFMYLFGENITQSNYIPIGNKDSFTNGLEKVMTMQQFINYNINIDEYWNYFSKNKINKIQNLKNMLKNNLKNNIFKVYSNGIKVG